MIGSIVVTTDATVTTLIVTLL